MKKLLYTCFSGFPNPNSGGPNKVIYELLKNINLNNYDVSYLSKHANFKYSINDRNRPLSSELGLKSRVGHELFAKSKFFRSLVTNPSYLRFNYKRAYNLFSSRINYANNFDIIHSHDPRYLIFTQNSKAIKILTIHSKGSIVRDLKDYYGNSFILNSLYNNIARSELKAIEYADIVTFPSIAAKNLYLSQLELKDDPKFRVIYNGVDLDEITKVKFDSKLLDQFDLKTNYDIKLLNISEHIKVKNIDKIIEIIFVLKKNYNLNPLLVNIGKGPGTTNLQNIVRKYNLSNNVRFIESLDNKNILSFMKWFDIFIMLSDRVIFDYVILEALASEMIVIASDNGGNREVIINKQNGYLFNNNEILLISETIAKLNYEIKKNVSGSISNFSIKNIYPHYENLYEISITKQI